MYYQIGEEHKEFCAEKTQDDDYYVLTLSLIHISADYAGNGRTWEMASQEPQGL